MGERETETETERETDRQRQRQTETETYWTLIKVVTQPKCQTIMNRTASRRTTCTSLIAVYFVMS